MLKTRKASLDKGILHESGWSKSTVNTLLGRMVDKGIIYYEDGGKPGRD